MKYNHYLNFLDLPLIGKIEISEPIGFDKSSYKVKRDKKRFGRDLIIANEDSEITFTRDFFEQMQVTQMLPDGTIIDYASLGFDFLLDVFQNEGWESRIEYILEKDGLSFVTGIFSYATAVVEFDNIKVKIIQNTNREIIKRLEDTDIDAFSSEALDGRVIEPCQTTNILLKAKPEMLISEWVSVPTNAIAQSRHRSPIFGFPDSKIHVSANNAFSVIKQGIRNTLSFISPQVNTNSPGVLNQEGFTYIYAQNQLTDVKIRITNILAWSLSTKSDFYDKISSANGYARFVVKVGVDVDNIESEYILYQKDFGNSSSTQFFLPTEFSLDLPILRQGYRVYIYAYCSANATFITPSSFESSYAVNLVIDTLNIKISATSTAIDTVVKGIRLIDLMKHNIKSIANMPLNAPIYDKGGEHYDNFAFNGLLLGQITDKPFYNKFKDLMDIPMEVCADYQINENNVEILPYSDFYKDIELAHFEELPSMDSQTKMNQLYSMKTANFKYKKSSSERETNGENSIDDVHTETQKYLSNMVDGELKVELSHIRSAFLIEEARQRAFDNEQTKSLQNDDRLFLLDCVPLAPSSKGGFGAVLLMQFDLSTHTLKILNNNLNGDGIPFNWLLLGFKVGDTFQIVVGQDFIFWEVQEITNTTLTLYNSSATTGFSGERYVVMSWFFTDVSYTNRTNQGFALIEGVANSTSYSNLNYSWGRNINRWKSYLATATKFKPNGIIKTASFINNGNLVTKKVGELVPIADNTDIVNAEIAQYKILNPFTHSVKVYSDFEKTTQLMRDIATEKGYVSVRLNDGRMIKGFVNDLDYEWLNEELTLEIEEKFISDFMEITNEKVTLTGYDDKDDFSSFQINNNFVLLFSSNDVRLFPPTRFTLIKINGILYTDLTAFTDALITLLNE